MNDRLVIPGIVVGKDRGRYPSVTNKNYVENIHEYDFLKEI